MDQYGCLAYLSITTEVHIGAAVAQLVELSSRTPRASGSIPRSSWLPVKVTQKNPVTVL